jgi:hypothetical protein
MSIRKALFALATVSMSSVLLAGLTPVVAQSQPPPPPPQRPPALSPAVRQIPQATTWWGKRRLTQMALSSYTWLY